MDPLLDIFNSFFSEYTKTNGWDSPASVWFWDYDSSQWNLIEESYQDPYDLIPTLVVHGYHGAAMFVVHGWAAPYSEYEYDEYGEPTRPSKHPERMRVRSFTYLSGENILNSYQIMGKTIEEVEAEPEGAIIDSIIIAIHKMKKYLAKEVYSEQD
jgi:hypothetical protein